MDATRHRFPQACCNDTLSACPRHCAIGFDHARPCWELASWSGPCTLLAACHPNAHLRPHVHLLHVGVCLAVLAAIASITRLELLRLRDLLPAHIPE
eukprot:310740-Chlamydomonas_euryale.AAC.1